MTAALADPHLPPRRGGCPFPSGGEEVVGRARALVGVRFRAQGRSAGGVDCVGLVVAAVGVSRAREDYALRGGSLEELEREIERTGLVRAERAAAGDVLVMQAGPGQWHLGVWTGAGLVHADAGLRRVVERPGAAPWPVVSVWRRCGRQAQQPEEQDRASTGSA